MRDIRGDLRERISMLDGAYADEMFNHDARLVALQSAHQQVVEQIRRERAALGVLLASEEKKHGGGAVPASTRKLVSLMDFLLTKVHANGPLDKDELRREAEAAGYFSEGNGRTFHTTLMNITKHGKLVQGKDGRYEFPAQFVTQFGSGETKEDDLRTLM